MSATASTATRSDSIIRPSAVNRLNRVLEEFGRSHARAFLVVAVANGNEYPSAWGRTVKEAERWAAHEALLVLEETGVR